MSSIKELSIKGVFWSAVDTISSQLVMFVTNIILARILLPEEFGLIGMTTIFLSISDTLINGGFSAALIRKRDCNDIDYSTIFYFNLLTSIVLWISFFFLAKPISSFLETPKLESIFKVLSFIIVINGVTIIQKTILVKRIDFKIQTIISLISTTISGTAAVILAFNGFGVWSLVALQMIRQIISSIAFWYLNLWRPKLIFSLSTFKQLFSFGSRMLTSSLIDTTYRNLSYFIIGKFYSSRDLGFYTRAELFNNIPAQNFTGIISRVSYPVLSNINDNISDLKKAYSTIIKNVMFITFIMMFLIAALAEPIILTLIGEKWEQSIGYLQMLTFVGMMYPLNALNINILKVVGRADIALKLEIIKKLIAIPILVIGILISIKMMIVGLWINTLIAYYLNSKYSGTLINYSIKDQLKDISFSLYFAVLISCCCFLLITILHLSPFLELMIGAFFGVSLIILLGEIFNLNLYIYSKEILLSIIKTKIIKK